jgi:hypothetical protein
MLEVRFAVSKMISSDSLAEVENECIRRSAAWRPDVIIYMTVHPAPVVPRWTVQPAPVVPRMTVQPAPVVPRLTVQPAPVVPRAEEELISGALEGIWMFVV